MAEEFTRYWKDHDKYVPETAEQSRKRDEFEKALDNYIENYFGLT